MDSRRSWPVFLGFPWEGQGPGRAFWVPNPDTCRPWFSISEAPLTGVSGGLWTGESPMGTGWERVCAHTFVHKFQHGLRAHGFQERHVSEGSEANE